jgi:hypothetical protein
MTAHAIRQYHNRLLHSIGIRKDKKRGHEFSVHGFGKYFKTRAEQSGMKPINVEILIIVSIFSVRIQTISKAETETYIGDNIADMVLLISSQILQDSNNDI